MPTHDKFFFNWKTKENGQKCIQWKQAVNILGFFPLHICLIQMIFFKNINAIGSFFLLHKGQGRGGGVVSLLFA